MALGDDRILVIKLGALGDMVQAFGPFQAIRRHHGHAHITLLTTAPFAEFAMATGWFDEVWVDARPRGASGRPITMRTSWRASATSVWST